MLLLIRYLGFILILTGYSLSQVRIDIDSNIKHQTFSGWESASSITSDCDSNYSRFRDAILPLLIDSVGITRLRLEVRSGSENTVDHYQRFIDDNCPSGTDTNYLRWRASRYATINDNNDTSINFNGFFFTELDRKIENVILPFADLVRLRGIKPYINLCYVAFTGQIKNGIYIHNIVDEYAEFVLATYLHIFQKYGFSPDTWELVLEPDNVSQWSGTLLGQAIVKSADRLKKYGFTPRFIGPSNTNMTNAVKYFDDMVKVPGAIDYLEEICYHRYGGVTQQSLIALADRGKQYEKKTSMLEWWFDNAKYNILHEDITVGNASSFQQATISGYFDINNSIPSNPVIKIKDITQYNRIYYTLIRPNAIRIGATSSNSSVSPVAVINEDGLWSIIIKSDIDTTISINGLANGNYSIITTNSSEKYKFGADLNVINNKLENINIRKGLLALRQNPNFEYVSDINNAMFSISPNPASDYIEISCPPSEKRGLGSVSVILSEAKNPRIFDLLGMEITTPSVLRTATPPYQGGEIVRIDVSHLSPGVYFVRVGDVVRKFVKI